ncbi:MAG: type IV pilus assembly protein PilM [Candidatus Wildermuthbacteria bacterium]|nr:type IV pilus assembly protein PilM [Candidatus Wildermuthbacteria bacterium]
MKFDFLTLHPEAFGLDLSDLSLKVASLKKTAKGLKLESFGEFPIPEGLVSQGEIQNEEELSRLIGQAVRSLKLQTSFVVASLPEEKAFLQVIQLPQMKQEEIKGAVAFEAENYIPYPVDTVYLDSEFVPPLKNSLDHMDVLVAALPKAIVDSYMSCFTKAGLSPRILEIESLATARALVPQETATSPVLLLDMGATRTGFAVFAGKSLRFTASIPVSGFGLTQALSQSLSLPVQEAEELKKTQSIGEPLMPLLSDLAKEVRKYMGYYESHASHQHLTQEEKRIKKVFLAGGGANLAGLSEFLSKELEASVVQGNPWVNIFEESLKELPPLPFDQSLKYATSLGLALAGLRSHD